MIKCTRCKQASKIVYSNSYNYESQTVKIYLCNKCLKIFVKILLDLMDYVCYINVLQTFSGKIIKKKG